MDIYLLDWANLLLRWLHVVTAIAWIGSSFYFVFLDNNLIKPQSPDLLEKGVHGALWAVHGGGFYNPQKYLLAPKKIHTRLHWFYWEAYSTWLSGFALFTVLYLWNASTFLIDKSIYDWGPWAAISAALVMLLVFWLVYDRACRLLGFQKNGELKLWLLLLLLIGMVSWLACQLFAGRAAFLLVGAAIATAMSANVFFWIIPGQRKVVAAMTSGQSYDPSALAIYGMRGKQRSVHNTYFTLPVLFAMLSNHYSFLYNHPQNWLILFLLMVAGALVRQFFVLRHAYHLGRAGNPLPYALAGVFLLLALVVWLKPQPAERRSTAITADTPKAAPAMAEVQSIIEQRCQSCHGAQVQLKNIRLDSVGLIDQYAQQIYQQAVVTRQMPLNNATGLTEAERETIKQWYEAR